MNYSARQRSCAFFRRGGSVTRPFPASLPLTSLRLCLSQKCRRAMRPGCPYRDALPKPPCTAWCRTPLPSCRHSEVRRLHPASRGRPLLPRRPSRPLHSGPGAFFFFVWKNYGRANQPNPIALILKANRVRIAKGYVVRGRHARPTDSLAVPCGYFSKCYTLRRAAITENILTITVSIAGREGPDGKASEPGRIVS
jgi:hypothetical protein